MRTSNSDTSRDSRRLTAQRSKVVPRPVSTRVIGAATAGGASRTVDIVCGSLRNQGWERRVYANLITTA